MRNENLLNDDDDDICHAYVKRCEISLVLLKIKDLIWIVFLSVGAVNVWFKLLTKYLCHNKFTSKT